MPYILVIDKMCAIKEINIKEYKEEDLYKKANFKSAEGFALQTTWTGLSLSSSSSSDISVSVYGKKAGKAMQENKYEFPPPIDSVLFFGGCVLVAKLESDDSIVDLRVSSWNKIYETLMGGFEDLDTSPLGEAQEEEEEDEEEEDVDPSLIGKNGYMRDGFVVEDEEEDEEEFEDMDLVEEEELVPDTESEEEVKPKKKSKRKPAAASTREEKKSEKKKSDKKKKSSSIEPILDISVAAVTDNYLDCSSELVEEEYV